MEKNGKVWVVGLGPGDINYITPEARYAIDAADIIIGYKTYVDLIKPLVEGKEVISNGMRREVERCEAALRLAEAGRRVALVSSGDPGIYGMAGILLEVRDQQRSEIDVEIIPGVTAVSAAAAALGAPLMHDFAIISLSDCLTDWAKIQKRLHCAGEGDFVIALYNPKSSQRVTHIQEAQEILLNYKNPNTPVGIVRNAKRGKEEVVITSLGEMLSYPIDMLTIVIIGNSNTYTMNNRIVTPRGYAV